VLSSYAINQQTTTSPNFYVEVFAVNLAMPQ
jgi:hypothetical protein